MRRRDRSYWRSVQKSLGRSWSKGKNHTKIEVTIQSGIERD